MRYVVEAKALTKAYGSAGVMRRRKRVMAVNDVSFGLTEKPTVVGLVGESGSGKSTIAKLLLDLITPTSGSVIYRGKSLGDLRKDEYKAYRRDVQGIFQDPYGSVNPLRRLRYIFNIMLKNLDSGRTEDPPISEVISNVGLDEEFLDKYPHEMSGGQLQRVLIARALFYRPKVIVADEPVSMLDASLRANVLKLMLDMKSRYDTSFLYITHDLSTAYYVADRLIVLYGGVIAEEGDARAIITNPIHPYTSELLTSIPKPDPSARWEGRVDVSKMEVDVREIECCKFYHRCPNVKSQCTKKRPSLVEVEEGHSVACFECT